LKSSEFVGKKGTFGFGTNNAQVLFDNLYVKSQIEDPTKEAIKKKNKLKSAPILKDKELELAAIEPAAIEQEPIEDDETKKQEVKYFNCTEANQKSDRRFWCKKQFATAENNVSLCEKNFCS